MTRNDTPTTICCPIEHATVDTERCAACGSRGSGHATCTGEDRLPVNDPSFLLLAL